MTEEVLRKYLEGTISADVLNDDLTNTVSRGRDVSYYHISNLGSDDKFIITTQHLIKLCRDIIGNKLKLADLDAIVFALETSDYFIWDTETIDGKKVEDAISNWSDPKDGNSVSLEYLQYCLFYLETGEHR